MGKKMKYEIAKSIVEEKEFQQPVCYHGAVSTLGSLPFEIQIKIVSFLPAADVISLGICSKYWRDLCFSNWAWKSLSIQRWPLLSEFLTEGYVIEDDPEEESNIEEIRYVIEDNPGFEWPPNIEEIQKDWKQFYCDRHRFLSRVGRNCGIGRRINLTKKFPNNPCTELASKGYSFIDVELISFSMEADLIVKLIGVLYSIEFLKVSRKAVAEALRRRGIHNKEMFTLVMRSTTKLVYNALVPTKERGYTPTLEELVMGNRICKNADGRIKDQKKKEKRIPLRIPFFKRTSRRSSYC